MRFSGIAGFISPNPAQHSGDTLRRMLQPLAHHPVHQQGTYVNPQLGLSCGWVSHQGSTGECLPVWNETRDICLIFSGEDFTDTDLIADLKGRGHVFDSTGASYLVHLYEEFGSGFCERLNGAFAGLLVDLRQQQIILFNDRYGLNRIYFHENPTGLHFASEAKALLRAFPALRKLDPRGLGEFFSCGCVLQNRTLFDGISLLPPASAWSICQNRDLRKTCYFTPASWESQGRLSREDYYQEFKQIWKRILPRYFRGDAKVGLSLTGGVDSRMILAWAPRGPGALPCYTFGGPYRDCKDVVLSRQIAATCGQQHDTINVGSDFLAHFPSFAEQAVYLSDGAMDVLGAIDLYVQRAAREIAPIRVTGTNGGEILRGLVAFEPKSLETGMLSPELVGSVSTAAQTYATELGTGGPSFTAFKQAPWFMTSKFVIERSDLLLRMPYFDNDLVRHVFRAPVEATQSNDLSLQLIADGNPALGRIDTDRGLGSSAIPGLKRARNLFEEFTFRAEYVYDFGMPQWLAKIDSALAPLQLERLFLGRHKFHHFRVFYRDELSGFVKEILLDSRTRNRPYLQPKSLEALVQGHTSGSRNYTLELHKLLAMELIQRKLIEQN